ncbi:MAG: DUF899 domain-containing protein [Rhizobiaceae bacterium]|nr:DUF899 domain-containing protein [Rhizobiaceae bacterium]MCV0407773.1 DUF899 domain-containing protein [Rhizobiaceae bacterium]
MTGPRIASREEWQAAREALLVKEKAHMRASDALAAERRRLPMVLVEKDYRFEGPDGAASLADLFQGRRQLIVYHHMLKPDDPEPCSGCAMYVDNLGHLSHLNARDTTMVLVSRAPIGQIEAFRERMGWTVPWYETTDDFNPDFGVRGGFGLNVFFRDDEGRIGHSYYTSNRAVEAIGTIWSLLDITPLGRQESWEDSPEGWPQTKPYQWWRLHDEYDHSPAREAAPACHASAASA